mmetsp:Transcript_17957/g.50260  ORF Transcript_17957/g.50260 Transcript_17957/m.50260 type:complete len:372 (-) Transcript_17957:191-1306(-)
MGDTALGCARCGAPAELQCPKCKELNLDKVASSFCSQECFKEAWPTHKALHNWKYCTKRGKDRSNDMPSFNWTGELRPYRIGPKREVPEHIPRLDYVFDGIPYLERASKQQNHVPIRPAKDIEGLRKVCRIAREILDCAHAAIRPGITTDEIDRIVHEATIERNAYPSPLNYYNFPKSVCTSVNEVICHGVPDLRPLKEGDIVNVDVTAYHEGFHGDLNETYVVGEVDDESKRLIKVTYECLMKALDHVKPGVRFREMGDIISTYAGKHNFSVVKAYCGHGIGDLFHCAPDIPHYAKNKAVGVMKEGMTFTVEPMINMGSWRDQTWPDGWTAVTEDGKRSAQFEHTILVTATGCEILTARLDSSPPLWWEE